MTVIYQYFKRHAALDLRSLAFFRVLAAALLFLMFSSCYAVTGPIAFDTINIPFFPASSAIAHAVIWVLSFTLLLGYQSRLSAWMLFVAFIGLQLADSAWAKEPHLLYTLLIVVFLPVGRFFSFDDAMDRGAREDGPQLIKAEPLNTSIAVVTKAAVILVFSLHIVSAFADPSNPVGALLPASLLLVAILLPVKMSRLRLLIVGGALALCLWSFFTALGTEESALPYWSLMTFGVIAIRSRDWDYLGEQRLIERRHSLKIYYDKPCGFCRKICFIFSSFMMLGRCQIAAAQTDLHAHALLQENDSWVVMDENQKHYLCWAALLHLMRVSPVWWILGYPLTWLGMGLWGKPIYRLIGSIRHWLSKLTARLLPYKVYRDRPGRYESVSFVVLSLVLFLFLSSQLFLFD